MGSKIFLLIFIFMFWAVNAECGEIYLFSSRADMQNSRPDENVSFRASEHVYGIGISMPLVDRTKDLLTLQGGIGTSKADISMRANIQIGPTTYTYQREKQYNTGMYTLMLRYRYHITSHFTAEMELKRSQNLLRRDEYMLKIGYVF